MKAFKTLVGVRTPLPDIAAAVRDRLPEIAGSLADVSRIDVTYREVRADGSTHLVNEWRIDPTLPGPIRQAISQDMLGWNDHAVWTSDLTKCVWRIEPFFMPGAIHCAGATHFEPAMGGRGTKATFSGEFSVDANALTKIPASLRGATVSAVEALVGSMVPRNFRKTIEAAAQLLE